MIFFFFRELIVFIFEIGVEDDLNCEIKENGVFFGLFGFVFVL